jgi:hypothetical protein
MGSVQSAATAVKVVTAAKRATSTWQAIRWRLAWQFQRSKARLVRRSPRHGAWPSPLPPRLQPPLVLWLPLPQCGGRECLCVDLSLHVCAPWSCLHPAPAAAAWPCVPSRPSQFWYLASWFARAPESATAARLMTRKGSRRCRAPASSLWPVTCSRRRRRGGCVAGFICQRLAVCCSASRRNAINPRRCSGLGWAGSVESPPCMSANAAWPEGWINAQLTLAGQSIDARGGVIGSSQVRCSMCLLASVLKGTDDCNQMVFVAGPLLTTPQRPEEALCLCATGQAKVRSQVPTYGKHLLRRYLSR